MSGSGALFKTGAGTLTLTGANSYTGGTVVSGGAIALAQDAALGAASGGVSLGDAVSSGTISFTNAAQLSSLRGFTLGSAGGVFNTTGGTVTLSGGISGTGGLTKTGAGVLELAHGNSYTGPTVVSEGTLRSGAANSLGTGAALLVNAGAALDLNGFGQSVSSLSGSGGIFLGTGTLTAGVNDASGAFAGFDLRQRIGGEGRRRYPRTHRRKHLLRRDERGRRCPPRHVIEPAGQHPQQQHCGVRSEHRRHVQRVDERIRAADEEWFQDR